MCRKSHDAYSTAKYYNANLAKPFKLTLQASNSCASGKFHFLLHEHSNSEGHQYCPPDKTFYSKVYYFITEIVIAIVKNW